MNVSSNISRLLYSKSLMYFLTISWISLKVLWRLLYLQSYSFRFLFPFCSFKLVGLGLGQSCLLFWNILFLVLYSFILDFIIYLWYHIYYLFPAIEFIFLFFYNLKVYPLKIHLISVFICKYLATSFLELHLLYPRSCCRSWLSFLFDSEEIFKNMLPFLQFFQKCNIV